MIFDESNLHLISTDQGEIDIDKVEFNIHTINQKKICIIRTISIDNYLICFDKNSLEANIPNNQIILVP